MACTHHDGERYVNGAYNGTYKMMVAINAHHYPAGTLSDIIEVFDKKVSRAEGDYVIMGTDFCTGGCGMMGNMHKDDCPFKPKPPARPKVNMSLPGGIKRNIHAYYSRC
mmetsp:Transcript_71187/g.141143  ORF Transcript_71187/g.141143 Transcript_71187/m.141143 type:complete len:109 (-) Transcript_71187:349-675(-)